MKKGLKAIHRLFTQAREEVSFKVNGLVWIRG